MDCQFEFVKKTDKGWLHKCKVCGWEHESFTVENPAKILASCSAQARAPIKITPAVAAPSPLAPRQPIIKKPCCGQANRQAAAKERQEFALGRAAMEFNRRQAQLHRIKADNSPRPGSPPSPSEAV